MLGRHIFQHIGDNVKIVMEIYYYDVNALSNFVADPLKVIGFNPLNGLPIISNWRSHMPAKEIRLGYWMRYSADGCATSKMNRWRRVEATPAVLLVAVRNWVSTYR